MRRQLLPVKRGSVTSGAAYRNIPSGQHRRLMSDGRTDSVMSERLCLRQTELGWAMESLESGDKWLSSDVTESRS